MLQNIRITNFKGLMDMTLSFQPGFNLLIGDNGVGKTSILEAISVSLAGLLAKIEGINIKHIITDEVYRKTEFLGDGSYNIIPLYPVKIQSTIELNGETYEWTRQKSTIKGRTTIEPRDVGSVLEQLILDPTGILPIISYQSAARMWAQKREKSYNVFNSKNYVRSVGYLDCLAEEANAKLITNWCRKMEEVSWQKEKKIAEYEAVKKAVLSFMQEITTEKGVLTNLRYDKQSEELIFLLGEKVLPVRLLSSGYQSLIWMVMDVAYRMSVLNPELFGQTTEHTPGIVLIDELDLHLHPQWQWHVIDALCKTFPKVQFIATTHSPILLASCRNAHIIKIAEDSETTEYESPYGFQVGDVLQYHQNSRGRTSQVEKIFSDFYDAVDQENLNEAQRLYNCLVSLGLRENTPDMVEAKISLDLLDGDYRA